MEEVCYPYIGCTMGWGDIDTSPLTLIPTPINPRIAEPETPNPFHLREAAVMSWRLETQSSGASPSPKKKRKSSESSPSKKAHLEEARELNVAFAEKARAFSANPKHQALNPPGFCGLGVQPVALALEASATLPQQHAVLDATFRTRDDGERRPWFRV